jgi:hypothetical protein
MEAEGELMVLLENEDPGVNGTWEGEDELALEAPALVLDSDAVALAGVDVAGVHQMALVVFFAGLAPD